MSRIVKFSLFIICIVISIIAYVYYLTNTVPNNFPIGKVFTVGENESLRSLSNRLENENYIHSALWFRVWVSSLGKDRSIQLGNYEFGEPYVLRDVVKKFVSDTPDKPLIQVTIPEGSTSFEVANLVHQVLPTIDIDIFGEKISQYEADGKLFPSTYFLLPSHTEEYIVKMMKETFEKKYMSTFRWTVIPEPLTNRDEVISLASIVEGEAKSEEDMKVVAGILLTRLKKKMPLQVDVAKETYTSKGLPNMPINNPGLVALGAVLHPTTSPYLFYITGKDGAMYYAKTFEEHKRNINKYLR